MIFDLCSFLINVDQNAQFPLLTLLRLGQFSCTEIGNFPGKYKSFNQVHNLHTKIGKFPVTLCLWMRYAIFISWIFAFPGYPIKKKNKHQNQQMQHDFLSPKQEKSANHQKSTYAKIPWWRCFKRTHVTCISSNIAEEKAC